MRRLSSGGTDRRTLCLPRPSSPGNGEVASLPPQAAAVPTGFRDPGPISAKLQPRPGGTGAQPALLGAAPAPGPPEPRRGGAPRLPGLVPGNASNSGPRATCAGGSGSAQRALPGEERQSPGICSVTTWHGALGCAAPLGLGGERGAPAPRCGLEPRRPPPAPRGPPQPRAPSPRVRRRRRQGGAAGPSRLLPGRRTPSPASARSTWACRRSGRNSSKGKDGIPPIFF